MSWNCELALKIPTPAASNSREISKLASMNMHLMSKWWPISESILQRGLATTPRQPEPRQAIPYLPLKTSVTHAAKSIRIQMLKPAVAAVSSGPRTSAIRISFKLIVLSQDECGKSPLRLESICLLAESITSNRCKERCSKLPNPHRGSLLT